MKRLKKNVLPIPVDNVQDQSESALSKHVNEAVDEKPQLQVPIEITKGNINFAQKNDVQSHMLGNSESEVSFTVEGVKIKVEESNSINSDEKYESNFEHSTDLISPKSKVTEECSQEDLYLNLMNDIFKGNVNVKLPNEKWKSRIEKRFETIFFYLENCVFNIEEGIGKDFWILNYSKMV